MAARVAISEGRREPYTGDVGWRGKVLNSALSSLTGVEIRRYLGWFREWLPSDLTTGATTGQHISKFLSEIRAKRDLSPTSVNRIRGYLSAMFGGLTRGATMQYFRSDPLAWFRDSAEALPQPKGEIVTYDAPTVIAFLEAAERHGDPNRTVKIKRRKHAKEEEFEQRVGTAPAPVMAWALLLACTGVRRGEAEKMRWSDIDLEHGVIRVFATKTNVMRYLPLMGDPTGDIAPAFVDVLRAWRRARPDDLFVLPSADGRPCFPKLAWEAVCRQAEVSVTPQGLRRTFESMLAAIGFPASLAAFWLGHSVQVAESHYRAYRPGRLPGNTLDAALGITRFLTNESRKQGTLRLIPRDETTAG